MRDTFDSIAAEVRATTTLDIELCRIAVRDAFRELRDFVNWSWLIKRGVMTIPAAYSTGTASLVQYSDLVNGSGVTWDSSMIGRQFRTSIDDPFYTIIDVLSTTVARISPAWAGSNITASSYSIFTAYITPPEDFVSFISVKDAQHSWRLNTDVDQSVLDSYDAKRSSSSAQPFCLSLVDYAASYNGKVGPTVVVFENGGMRPSSSGSYTGATDAIFVIVFEFDGPIDVATFKWKKNNGNFTTGVVASSLGNILPEGVTLTWATAGDATLGDTYVLRTTAISNPGLPRFELYPYPTSQTILHYQYLSSYPDISDANVQLPIYISGHIIKEGALGRVARIPGTDDKPNPYAQRARGENHEERFVNMLTEAARRDEEVFCRSIQSDLAFPYAPMPWGQSYNFDPLSIYPGFGNR